ncbi:hypothetical protein IFU01_08450 [Oxalobacteraceae sp. CFBP 8763]|nr:hypothetical protein [Oxalobacteraceae sp. CFBP 8763]
MGIHTEAVQKLYVAYFSRPADTAGLTYWEGVVAANGGSTAAVSTAFAASKEYTDTFAGQSQYQVVNTVYMNLFGRAAEPAALAFWGQALVRGDVTIAGAVTTIAGAAQGTDATTYANKVKAATAFTEALDTSAEILGYTGTGANLAAKTFLAGITTDASLTTAIVPSTLNSSIATVIQTGSSSTGQSFSLTSTIGEQVNGTAGSDVFTAVVDAAGTFNTGDTINGLGGQDTLNLLVTAGATMPAGATVSNVEIVNLTHVGASGTLELNSNMFSGVQQLWQIDNTNTSADFQDVTVGTGVTAGFRSTGANATNVAADVAVTVAAGTTAAAVALDGVKSGSAIEFAETTVNNLSTVTVSGSVITIPATTTPVAAAQNTLALTATAADVDVLNVSLTSNTTVTMTGFDDLTSFNAAGSTGNLTVALGTPDELTSATFGSGNDTVTLSTVNLGGDALTINLGAGNDVLNLTAGLNAGEATSVTITMGAGSDTLNITGLTNMSGSSATAIAADMVVVSDFVAASDVLNVSALGPREVLVNTELANIAAATDFAAALALVASYTAVDSYAVFNFGSDAYIFNNAGTAALGAGDGLVKVVGLSVASLSDSNFVA